MSLSRGASTSLCQSIEAHMAIHHQLFTGRMPFHDVRHDATVILRVVNNQRPPRPDNVNVPFEIWLLILQCWSHEPSLRPRIRSVSSPVFATQHDLSIWLLSSLPSESVASLPKYSCPIRERPTRSFVPADRRSEGSAMSVDGLSVGRVSL
jgi:hypothetical protein